MVPVVLEIVTNLDAPKAIEFQAVDDGNARDVQVTPSGDVAEIVEPDATVTKALFP